MLLRLFGGFELLPAAGQPLHPPTRKTALLLAALGVAGDKGLTRDMLCSMFWPDRADPQARGSLRQSLAAIRVLLAGSGSLQLAADQEGVFLAGEAAEVDVRLFDRLRQDRAPESFARAAELYRGDLLAGVALTEPAEPWFEAHRRAFRASALALCEELGRFAEGGIEQAAGPCESLAGRLLAADQTAEEAHRALIRLHLSRGRTNAAARQFELCREVLRRELSLEPEAATFELAAAARSQRPAPLQAASEPPLAPARRDPAGGALDQPSIVVMPFDNLSGAEDDYFVDGVVEEITAALSRVRNFFVIARQSAYTYKGRAVDVRQVGEELGVAYVVEGTVRRGGERLRISVQLVDAQSRTQLWSERYDGVTTDIFDFQDQIASQVAAALHPAIRKAEIDLARRKPPNSLRAYDLVMRAWANLWGQNAEANELAMSSLREALEVDPAYGRAQALLAWCHAIKATYVWSTDPAHELDEARRLVETIPEAIDDDPTALTAAGATLSLCGDIEGAGALIGQALSLDPNNAWAWTRFGWLGVYRNEAAAAKERFERAMALSPLDPFAFNMRMGIAVALAMSGSLAPAIAIVREVIQRYPEVTWAYRQLAAFSALAGDLETARWAARKLMEAQPDFTMERYCALLFLRDAPGWADQMTKGLRLAGLPER